MADNLTPIVVKTKADGDVNVDINAGPTGASALQTQGTVADGIAPNANPVLVAGFDGTLTQSISVDASGNVQVDILTLPVAPANDGVDIGDVDVTSILPGFGGTNLGKREDDPHTTLDVGIQMLAVRKATPVDISSTDGDYEPLQIDVGRLWVSATIDAAIPAGGNIIGNVGLEAGSNNIGDVDILTGPTGASALEMQGTAADGAAAAGNPVMVGGEEAGGNVQSLLVDANGHLQIDVLTGGGSDTPTNPRTSETLVNLASGISGDVDDTDVGATTFKLVYITMSSSLPWKARIMTVADAVETVVAVLFGQANTSRDFKPTHRDYIQQGAAGAGFDGFRVEFTNMDNLDTGDFYASFYSEE